LAEHAAGRPNAIVEVNGDQGGLVLFTPGSSTGKVLYAERV
jgi:hypothetical protein